ncbi:MAG: lysine--tRNA ligase [bacterium]
MSENYLENIDPTDHRAIRVAKTEHLREIGIDPYPARIPEGRVSIESIRADWENLKQITEEREVVRAGAVKRLAGRITAVRSHGKSMFVVIQDGTGQFQFYIRKNTVEENMAGDEGAYDRAKELDIGDFITAEGEFFTTHTGEATLMVYNWQLLSKSLLPMPEKYHGLTDPDLRLRQRYLDLLANPEVKRNLTIRALVIRSIREFLEKEHGYIELETPALTSLYGGAAARPFTTHHNALDIDLYLRIATELYLKRLIVGGFERVYEMGKVFRNEGVDRDHNPEFTLLELYEAYADYNRMMELAEGMVIASARAVAEFQSANPLHDKDGTEVPKSLILSDGKLTLNIEGEEIAMEKPFPRKSFVGAILEATGIDVLRAEKSDLVDYLKKHDIDYNPNLPFWPLVDKLFSETVEASLVQPTFLVDYPVGLSPLAKRKADQPELTERFELFILGKEIANAFSELNDPIDQRARMESQVEQAKQGDDEAPNVVDEDFLTALEHGMPPTGGMGVGVGRLVAILAGAHAIKEVIPFPLVKPR